MLVEITNTLRNYAWGSLSAIADLRGVEPSGKPEAELWLGTHPSSPALLARGPGTLLEVTGAPLPFLLKVLAASTPLSLQVHPDTAQAEAGFARENDRGIPIDAPDRNYRDRSAKPEMLYALGPFRALAGFRSVRESRASLSARAGDERITPFVTRLAYDGSLRAVVEWLITRGPGVPELLEALGEVHPADPDPDPSWDTVRLLADHYPGDPGIAVSLLMNTVELAAGEVLSQSAGILHSYLVGTGVELMSASDNVVRGGLTPKHVDVTELLEIVDFATGPAPRVLPEIPSLGVHVYRSPDAPFGLIAVDPAGVPGGVRISLAAAAIAITVSGTVVLDDGSESCRLVRGAALYASGPGDLTIDGRGSVVIACGQVGDQ